MAEGAVGYDGVVIDPLLTVLGCLLVLVVVADAFRTVLWSSRGAGPLTALITRAILHLTRRIGERSRNLLSGVGPFALVLVVSTWVVLLLVGFVLALQFDHDGIRSSITHQPADIAEQAYYVGYTLFTLGTGEYEPTTDWARAASVVINAAGMFLITLSVTYVLPVISASVQSRSFGSAVLSLGSSPEEIITGAWDGERIHLDHQVREFSSELTLLAHQHLAYPLLHLFHSSRASSSAPLGVAVADEVLTLLDAVDPSVAPPAPGRRQLRSSIELYAQTYGRNLSVGDPPPAPSLDALVEAGIPLVHDQWSFARLVEERNDHRGRMRRLTEAAGLSDHVR